MYEFILLQYKMHRISEDQVRSLVPQYLTADQAEAIITGETDK